jgi:hypothetical protein
MNSAGEAVSRMPRRKVLLGAALALVMAVAAIPLGAMPAVAVGITYYVSSSTGSDSNSGTSSGSPWRTFAHVNSAVTYGAGDSILLKSGDTWTGETLAPNGSGTAASPILISNYGAGALPHINRNAETDTSSRGIHITDDDGYKITNIEVSHAFYGILFEYSSGVSGYEYVWIEDVSIHDMNHNTVSGYPWAEGIAIHSANMTSALVLQDITIRDIVADRITAAIWIGKHPINDPDRTNYQNVDIINITATHGRSLQVVTQNATDVLWDNVKATGVGHGYGPGLGVAGSGLEHTQGVTIQNSEFADVSKGSTRNVGDGDGFDLEGDTGNSTFQNVYFHDSEGPGLMVYSGASGLPHTNFLVDDSIFNAKAWGQVTPHAAIWYTASNSHTGTVTDTTFYLSAGEALTAGSPADVDMRGNTEYRWAQIDDREALLTYSGTWTTWTDTPNYLTTEKNSSTTGNYVEYTFYGQAIEWIGDRYSTYGKADVYLDGSLVSADVDLYAPEKRYWQNLYSNLNLSLGFHTLKIVVDGTKNPASSGYNVNIDYLAYAISPVRVYDDAETGAITYNGTWSTFTDTGDYGSTEHNGNITSNSAQLSFTGTGVQWIGAKYNSYGKANIYVDGVLKVNGIDQYSSTKQYQQVLYQITGLSSGAHTIKVEVAGTKNASSSGFYVNVDDFRVLTGGANQVDDRSTAVTYAGGSWAGFDDPWLAYGGTETNSNTTSHYVQYTFTGTSIAWIGAKNFNLGKANVYIDGVLQINGVDQYASSKQYQQVLYLKTGLTNASHTIKIEVAGTKNASSSGYYVNVDAFVKG